MKILYIDNRMYGHNSDLHIHFFQHIAAKRKHAIYGYGDYMNKYFDLNKQPNKENPKKDFQRVLKDFKPDVILSYNCNGSSYELKYDNVGQFQWIAETLSEITSIPKFHITTDYCRSGFKQEQADWFKDIGYSAAIFRHKVSLSHPIEVAKYWLPFSVDSRLYSRHMSKDMYSKHKKVGFLGAAHNSAKRLYENRIAAMDFLKEKNLLKVSEVVNNEKFERKMLFGQEYVRFWTNNLFGLTCGGTCNFMTAKYFQIPAAYSMLVCPETDGLEIFPKDTYITYDKRNLDDLYIKLQEHIKDLPTTARKIKTLHKVIMDKHSHDERANDLTRIFKKHI